MTILEALCEIVNDADQTANARIEPTGLRDRMDELETAILTELWYEILIQFNKISVTLHTAGIALNTAVGLLKSLIDFVQQKCDKFDHFELARIKSPTIDYGPGTSGYDHTHEHRARDAARAFLQRCYRRIREGKVAQEAHLGQLKLLCGSYSYVCLAVNNVYMSA